jgi:uncharacterized protein YeaO (DUF488 family)
MADVTTSRVREYVAGAVGTPGTRTFLVDRLWPRGIKKTDLDVPWVKDVAPSSELRSWFGHRADRWAEFRKRYLAELKDNRDAAEPLVEAARSGPVQLLYDAKDTEHNEAVVLAEWLRRVVR